MKLLLTVLVFIVLPTAWLSLLAGRSIQSRELLLERRMEAEAQQTLEHVGTQTKRATEAALGDLSAIVKRTVLAGQDIRDFADAVVPPQRLEPLIGPVYLYLHPWGFIFPDRALPDHATVENHYILLAQDLAQRLRREHSRLLFEHVGRIYVFGLVQENPDLYVGYEVQQDGLVLLVEALLRSVSTPHIQYRLLRVGSLGVRGDEPVVSTIEVRDSLTGGAEYLEPLMDFQRDAGRRDMLLSGHLREPFRHIEIGAMAVNVREMYAARALQARLVRWSILLLAFVLLSSTILLLAMGRRQLERARIRNVFIAGLSHDIRTPVTAMRALAESLQQGRVSTEERKQQFLDSIVSECDRLQTLIERVLLFFRQEQGGDYHKKPVALVPLCERVCHVFRTRHRGKVDLRLDMPSDAAPTMWADGAAIEQAILNILENAWKYGRREPVHPDQVVVIRLRLAVEPGSILRRCLQIAVDDEGPGVAPAERRKVFLRFYRTQSATKGQSGGIGLGLALVAEVVRGHGGRIRVEQGELGGASFVMRFRPFPLRRAIWLYACSVARRPAYA
ncbi:MAG: sensor histidine kinase [Kiritimatiellia bacterium]